MFSRSGLFILLILMLFAILTAAQEPAASMQITANFDERTEEISGRVTINISDEYKEDILFFSAVLNQETDISILETKVDGQVVVPMISAGQLAVERGSGKEITIDFKIAAFPQSEGIYYFAAGEGKEKYSWFPRLIEEQKGKTLYSFNLTISGPGAVALPAGYSIDKGATATDKLTLAGKSYSGPCFIYSPLFVEKRIIVGGCNLGLFMREGSEVWQEKALTYLSEVYSYYKEKIPQFSFTRLDAVFTGEVTPEVGTLRGLLIMEDEVEKMSENFGNVFAANYIRWKSSLALSLFFWSDIIDQGEQIPWLSRGLSLYWAEKYNNQALLGGPAFDNIRQFYLNAASSGADTSLDRKVNDLEKSGIDVENVLARSKGLWVTKILSRNLGNNAFRRFQESLVLSRNRLLDNQEIIRLAEEASGKSLKSFADAWIRGNATLDYKITNIDNRDDGAEIELESKGDVIEAVSILISYEDGSEDRKEITFPDNKKSLLINVDKRVARARIDPDGLLPDINRADNLLSKMGSERIKQLYSIDDDFEIGDIVLKEQPEKTTQGRSAPFFLSLVNKQEETAYLALNLTLRFPGGRNRGVTSMLLELAPGEERTIDSEIQFPMRGIGLAYLTAEYFRVEGEEGYAKLNRNSKPTLSNIYVFNITQ